MPAFSTKSLSVKQLFTWFDECRFAVPEIQREFVWNTSRACALLDSIYKGYPVGKGTYDASEKAAHSALLSEDYLGRSALSSAFRLLLARQSPGYLDNGEPILLGQTASRRNARELHHIWPRELLRRQGVSPKRFNTICNICFLATQDNRSFGARHPLSYLESFQSRKHFARVMKSHFIPYQKDSPLWDKNVPRGFKVFIERRRDLIETAFNEAAGVNLFEK